MTPAGAMYSPQSTIWITGQTHSGTTLLSSLMDGHPECLVYPVEPRFETLFDPDRISSAEEMQRHFLFETKNALHFQDALNPSADRSPALLKDLVSASKEKKLGTLKHTDFKHRSFFKSYFERLLELFADLQQPDPKIHVEAAFDALQTATRESCPELETGLSAVFKDPLARFRPERLTWFFENWPEGKVVLMRRNPFARLWSRIQHDMQNGRANVRLATNSAAFHQLCRSFARDHTETAVLPKNERILTVNYEDLTSDPERWMRNISAFAGIEYDDIMSRPTSFGYGAQPSTNRTGNVQVTSNSQHKWRKHLTRSEKALMGFYLAKSAFRRCFRQKPA
jgi:hypothetical protein